MEVIGQLHVPAALSLEKRPQVIIGEEAGWASEPVWTLYRRENSLKPAGNRIPDTQLLAHSCTN
jgi:hypothetical protein